MRARRFWLDRLTAARHTLQMPSENLIALFAIAATAAFTPGPNNALAATSGAIHGVMRTMPHIMGIVIGFPVMIFLVGLFLGEIFQQSPVLRQTLRYLGAGVLLWMAWRTATAGGSGKAESRRPFTFVQSAAFQRVNPKGWAFAIGVTAQFVSPDAPIRTALICALVFALAGAGSAMSWTLAGQALTRWLNSEIRRRAFNYSMAALLALSVVVLFIG